MREFVVTLTSVLALVSGSVCRRITEIPWRVAAILCRREAFADKGSKCRVLCGKDRILKVSGTFSLCAPYTLVRYV
jgi:hypothetical protein